MTMFIIDACALIAFMRKEEGWERVRAVLISAHDRTVMIQMHAFNLLEVYYDMYRSIGKEKAEEELEMIRSLPISINSNLTSDIFKEAGRLKASYRISKVTGGILVTSDHHEFDAIENKEPIQFLWIR